MTLEQREAELLELLADHKIHEMREVYALDETCSLLEWYRLAEVLEFSCRPASSLPSDRRNPAANGFFTYSAE